MISLIINTASLEGTGVLSNAKQPHAWRAYALRNFILPQYIADPYIDEVIVVGSFEEGDGFTYIRSPSVYKSWRDCIQQRQLGFEASKGDVLIFQHDDHLLENKHYADFNWCELYDAVDKDSVYANKNWQVLSPSRYTRLRNVNGERLNNGELGRGPQTPYISGHCAIYRREVIEACQWKDVPQVWIMDVEHTKQIVQAGFKIVWTDAVKIWDVDFGSEPWK